MMITGDMLQVQMRAEQAAQDRGLKGPAVAQAGLEAVAPLVIAAHERDEWGAVPAPILAPAQAPGVAPTDFDDGPAPMVLEYPEQVWRSDALQAVCTLMAQQAPGITFAPNWPEIYRQAEQAARWIATGDRP